MMPVVVADSPSTATEENLTEPRAEPKTRRPGALASLPIPEVMMVHSFHFDEMASYWQRISSLRAAVA
jgi:hypothetical protein